MGAERLILTGDVGAEVVCFERGCLSIAESCAEVVVDRWHA